MDLHYLIQTGELNFVFKHISYRKFITGFCFFKKIQHICDSISLFDCFFKVECYHFFFFFKVCIYFWLHWVFVAAPGW